MLSDFGILVSDLYTEWADCLMQSLTPWHRTYFESICNGTATKADLTWSLRRLTGFLVGKFGKKVIVLIDEYEAPNNRAYEYGYFKEVCSLYPSLCPLVLRTSIPGQ